MIEKGKQLTLSQRNKIEEMLNQRRRKFEIANELDKTQSTIAEKLIVIKFWNHTIYTNHQICLIVNSLLIAKSVQINVEYFNQFLAKIEIETLVFAIIVQNLKLVILTNIFILQKKHIRNINTPIWVQDKV